MFEISVDAMFAAGKMIDLYVNEIIRAHETALWTLVCYNSLLGSREVWFVIRAFSGKSLHQSTGYNPFSNNQIGLRQIIVISMFEIMQIVGTNSRLNQLVLCTGTYH